MTLVLGQIVKVRRAVQANLTLYSGSVGQIYDDATSTWQDVVWVELNGPLMREFGDVFYWCQVTSLSFTYATITRPRVAPMAYCSGGVKPDGFTMYDSGGANIKLTAAGADIVTTLPGVGALTTIARASSHAGPGRLGWTGRLPASLLITQDYQISRWIPSFTNPASSNSDLFVSPLSGFSPDLASFNTWLATNQPEWLSSMYIGATVALPAVVSGSTTTVAVLSFMFDLYASASFGPTWMVWAVRSSTISQGYSTLPMNLCDGRSGVAMYSPGIISPSSTTPAGASSWGGLGVTNALPAPAVGGGTLTMSPRVTIAGVSSGVDVALTVNAQGRFSGIAVTGVPGGTVNGWGAVVTESGNPV